MLRDTLTATDATPLTAGYIGLGAGQGSVNNGTFEGIVISSMTVSVPEPSTLALLALAGVGIFAVRRSRHGNKR